MKHIPDLYREIKTKCYYLTGQETVLTLPNYFLRKTTCRRHPFGKVHGIIRRASTFNTKRIDHLYKDPHNKNIKMFLHYGDMTDSSNLNRILEKVQPDEIYPEGMSST